MKPNQYIYILLSLFLTFSFSEDLRVEIIKRYDNGNKKLLVKYRGDDGEEVLVEKINYSESGDTLIWENYDSKGERDGKWISCYENRQINWEENYKDGMRDGKWIVYYENGQINWEENYKDGMRDGKRTSYYKNRQIWDEGNRYGMKETTKRGREMVNGLFITKMDR